MPPTVKIIRGDCIEAMKGMDENSIDSIVTDPPAGIAFMGSDWDDFEGERAESDQKSAKKNFIEFMMKAATECLRVLKPGGHALVWALPRTSHWTATALEDAGFEIRDCVYHCFSTGFPKSLDISKAIDKAEGAERELGPTVGELNGRNTANHKKAHDILAQVNGWDKPTTKPATEAAKQWEGYGTHLKPAIECWWLCRKPISERTIAENVMEHGTGGLNIDGCRIEYVSDYDAKHQADIAKGQANATNGRFFGGKGRSKASTIEPQGRFPSHLIHDGSDDVLEMFPVSGGSGKARVLRRSAKPEQEGWGMNKKTSDEVVLMDAGIGSAARFFYCAKSPKDDKDSNGAVKNTHPTAKSSALMAYLCKLITPPKGTVLDPFMGSGSTGIGAIREGFNFIGIEKDEKYIEIAQKRIERTQYEESRKQATDALGLFDQKDG